MPFITQGKANIKYLLIIIFFFLLCIGGILIYTRNTINVSEKSKENKDILDPKNCTYPIGVKGMNITLKDGYSEDSYSGERLPPGSTSSAKLITQYFGKEAVGDFNGDGFSDVIFIFTQHNGVRYSSESEPAYYIIAALGSTDGCKGTNAVFIGNGIIPQTTEFQNGKIIVNYIVNRDYGNSKIIPTVITKQFAVENMTLKDITPEETIRKLACVYSSGNYYRGIVSTSTCCKSVDNFPNTCLIGVCNCSQDDSYQVEICDCGENKCFDGKECQEAFVPKDLIGLENFTKWVFVAPYFGCDALERGGYKITTLYYDIPYSVDDETATLEINQLYDKIVQYLKTKGWQDYLACQPNYYEKNGVIVSYFTGTDRCSMNHPCNGYDYIYFTIYSKNELSSSSCEKVLDDSIRDSCYSDFALKTMNPSLCNSDSLGCFDNIAKNTQTLSDCQKLMPDGIPQDVCLRVFAIKDKSFSLCEKISNQDEREFCYYQFSINTDDTSVCDKISDIKIELKKDCYYGICGKISDTTEREKCKQEKQ